MRDKELFLYELVEEVKKDMDQAHVPYNDECPIKLNNRLISIILVAKLDY